MTELKDVIRFESTKDRKKRKIIDIVNETLANDQDFLELECLSGDLEEYTKDFHIKLIEKGTKNIVDLAPKSGEGHDFMFFIRKKTKRIDRDSLSVGSVIQPPDD